MDRDTSNLPQPNPNSFPVVSELASATNPEQHLHKLTPVEEGGESILHSSDVLQETKHQTAPRSESQGPRTPSTSQFAETEEKQVTSCRGTDNPHVKQEGKQSDMAPAPGLLDSHNANDGTGGGALRAPQHLSPRERLVVPTDVLGGPATLLGKSTGTTNTEDGSERSPRQEVSQRVRLADDEDDGLTDGMFGGPASRLGKPMHLLSSAESKEPEAKHPEVTYHNQVRADTDRMLSELEMLDAEVPDTVHDSRLREDMQRVAMHRQLELVHYREAAKNERIMRTRLEQELQISKRKSEQILLDMAARFSQLENRITQQGQQIKKQNRERELLCRIL